MAISSIYNPTISPFAVQKIKPSSSQTNLNNNSNNQKMFPSQQFASNYRHLEQDMGNRFGYTNVESDIQKLFNTPVPDYMKKAYAQIQQKGLSALAKKKAPAKIPTANLEGYKFVTAQSHMGKEFVPQSVKDFNAKVQSENANIQGKFQKAKEGIQKELEQLTNPQVLRSTFLSYAKNTLDGVLKQLGEKFGFNYTKPYESLEKTYDSNQKFQQSMNNLFTNYLHLNWDVEPTLNQLVQEQTYQANQTAEAIKKQQEESAKEYATNLEEGNYGLSHVQSSGAYDWQNKPQTIAGH